MSRPGFTIEATIGVPTGYTRFLIGNATEGKIGFSPLGGPPFGAGVWANLNDRAMSVSITAGRQRLLDRHQAATCAVVFDNSDRALDPTDLNGPYVDAGVSLIRPMAELRVLATVTGSDFVERYTLFHGYIDAWRIAWNDPSGSTVTVTATDGFKLLGGAQLATIAAAGAGETEGQRVTRILDAADWSSTLRDIDDGELAVAATTHGSSALDELQTLTASTLGRVFMADNTVTYRSRRWRDLPVNANIYWTFTDGTPSLYQVNYDLESLVTAYDDDLIVNHAEVTPSGGSVQTVDDSTSQGLYGIRGYTVSSVLSAATDALSHAQRVVNLRSDPELRFDRLTIEPDGYDTTDADSTVYRAALGLRFDERVTVVRTPPKTSGTNTTITRTCFVEGWHHEINPFGRGWRSTFQLSDAEAWPDAFVIGVSLLGTGTITW